MGAPPGFEPAAFCSGDGLDPVSAVRRGTRSFADEQLARGVLLMLSGTGRLQPAYPDERVGLPVERFQA